MIFNRAKIGQQEMSIIIENGKIKSLSDMVIPGGIDLQGKRVIPGLIDVHTHGVCGQDTMDGNFERLCALYAEKGTTSFLPTLMTAGYEDIQRVTNAQTRFSGAQILGLHLEGPFLSPKYKGAQNQRYIRLPDEAFVSSLSNVKMMTVAPELPGCDGMIRSLSDKMVISLGHTDCDYETALSAFDAGATCLTHTFNAMPPFHHRAPGPIGAAVERQTYAQIICDGIHIAKPMVLAAYRMFGPERLVLISDSIAPAGLPDGTYQSGGLEVTVKNQVIRLSDGTLAGSYACLWDCVREAVKMGIPFDHAVRMATATPAEMLGIQKGKLLPGYDGDLLVIDDDMEIRAVVIGGKIVNEENITW